MSAPTADTAASSAPNDRATEFKPIEGPTEHYSGEVLLVSAYAILWAILLAWVASVWRKQRGLDARLRDLEREIDKTATSGRDRAA